MYPIDGTETMISPMTPDISWPTKHDVLGVQVSATTYAEIIELLIEARQLFTEDGVILQISGRDPIGSMAIIIYWSALGQKIFALKKSGPENG